MLTQCDIPHDSLLQQALSAPNRVSRQAASGAAGDSRRHPLGFVKAAGGAAGDRRAACGGIRTASRRDVTFLQLELTNGRQLAGVETGQADYPSLRSLGTARYAVPLRMSAASFYENAALALDYAMGGHHWFPDATGAGVRNFRLHGVEDANASPRAALQNAPSA